VEQDIQSREVVVSYSRLQNQLPRKYTSHFSAHPRQDMAEQAL